MSFIIDTSKHRYFSQFEKVKNIGQEHIKKKKEEEDMKLNNFSLVESLKNILKSQQSCYHCQVLSANISKITLQNQIALSEGRGLIKCHTNDTNRSISVQIDILNKSSNYLIIQNQQKRNLLNKLIMTKNHIFSNNLFKINFNLNCGKLTLWLPLFYFFEGKQFEYQSGIKRISILNKLISYVDSQTKNLMRLLDQLIFQKKKLAQYSIHNAYPIFYGKEIKKLFKFNQLSNVYKIDINGIQIVTENTLRQEQIKEIQSKKDLIQNKYKISIHFHKINSLYLNNYSYTDQIIRTDDCDLHQKDYQMLNTYLQVPTRVKNKSTPSINLLTEIYIKDIEQIKLMPMNKGGFAEIYQTQLQFYYVNNINNPKDKNFTKQISYKNIFALKKQLINKNSKARSKNDHEYEIINHMKNSASMMINRYYVPLNKENRLNNDILMDRISLTLSQFISITTKQLSLQTKLYFILNIIQCLRSINAYNIVHLDLKLSNLMLNDQLILKLIDFGQSYHPKLSDLKDFKPGFSMPYSCPQIYQKNKHFTIKSDVYSLGVILYEMIYKKFPFFIYDNRSIMKKYTNKQYMKIWYYNYEQTETYGQNLVYLILDQLIFKCLHQQPQKRPELQMLALIISQCITILS